MHPLDILMQEHRLIERVLSALAAYAGRLDQGADPADLGQFVMFIEQFADGCHHVKEEQMLFEAMVRAGFPREAGPVAVMLGEHADGRYLVAALRELSSRAGSWTADDIVVARRTARAYVMLLRSHIAKEDSCLYAMARARLPEEVFAAMGEQFARFEAQQSGAGEHERLRALAEQLTARHAAAEQAPAAPPAACCN